MAPSSDEYWAARPCSRRWSANRRPCAWFRAGHDCNVRWSELVAPTNHLVMGAAYLNLCVVATCLAYALAQRPHRGFKVARRRGPTAHQRAVMTCLCAFACQGVAYADVDDGRLPVEARSAVHSLIRFFFELSLFETGFAFRGALHWRDDSLVSRIVIGSLAFACLSTVTALEFLGVPVSARPACTLRWASLARVIVPPAIELSFCIKTLMYAMDVRRNLRKQLDRQTRVVANDGGLKITLSGLESSKDVIRVVEARIFALSFFAVLICVAMFWGLFTVVIAVATRVEFAKYACGQPACSPIEYLSINVSWIFGYMLVDWLCVVFLVVPACFVNAVNRSRSMSIKSSVSERISWVATRVGIVWTSEFPRSNLMMTSTTTTTTYGETILEESLRNISINIDDDDGRDSPTFVDSLSRDIVMRPADENKSEEDDAKSCISAETPPPTVLVVNHPPTQREL